MDGKVPTRKDPSDDDLRQIIEEHRRRRKSVSMAGLHEKARVTGPHSGADIDPELAPLIKSLWTLGSETTESCQDSEGTAYIQFLEPRTGGVAFIAFLRRLGVKHTALQRWTHYHIGMRAIHFRSVRVTFAKEDIPRITSAIALEKNSSLNPTGSLSCKNTGKVPGPRPGTIAKVPDAIPAAMGDDIQQRISRIYAAIGAIEVTDPEKLKAKVVRAGRCVTISKNYRGDLSDEDLLNRVHSVIHNIANLQDHLRRWAANNGHDKEQVAAAFNNSFELQVIQDLSDNDKHGYPKRDDGKSKRSPRLIEVTQSLWIGLPRRKFSFVAVLYDMSGAPHIEGNGTAKVVATGQVVDKANAPIGDLYGIATKAIAAWEHLLVDFGLSSSPKSQGQ